VAQSPRIYLILGRTVWSLETGQKRGHFSHRTVASLLRDFVARIVLSLSSAISRFGMLGGVLEDTGESGSINSYIRLSGYIEN
jgi:hypothetical protein